MPVFVCSRLGHWWARRISRHAAELTQWLSARQRFADAFYEFNQSGRMTSDVTAPMLSLDAPVGRLRNLGLVLLPTPQPLQFGLLRAAYLVDLDVADDGTLDVLSPLPEVSFQVDGLAVTAQAVAPAGVDLFWDFGEGSKFQSENEHTYASPGKYQLGLRLVDNGRLQEYAGSVVVSRDHTVVAPLAAFPSWEVVDDAAVPAGLIRVRASADAYAGSDTQPTSNRQLGHLSQPGSVLCP